MTRTALAFADDEGPEPIPLFDLKPASIADLKRRFGEQLTAAHATLIDIEKRVLDTIDLMDKSIAEHDCYD